MAVNLLQVLHDLVHCRDCSGPMPKVGMCFGNPQNSMFEGKKTLEIVVHLGTIPMIYVIEYYASIHPDCLHIIVISRESRQILAILTNPGEILEKYQSSVHF